jgi:hypothetical protein
VKASLVNSRAFGLGEHYFRESWVYSFDKACKKVVLVRNLLILRVLITRVHFLEGWRRHTFNLSRFVLLHTSLLLHEVSTNDHGIPFLAAIYTHLREHYNTTTLITTTTYEKTFRSASKPLHFPGRREMKLVTTGVLGTALRTALEHRRDGLETLFGFGI